MKLDARPFLFARYVQLGNQALAAVAGLALLIMMAVGVIDIIGTNLFSNPLPGAHEAIANLMVLVVFFSIPLAQSNRAHIRVELILNMTPWPVQFILNTFQYTANLAFFALLAWFSWESALNSIAVGEYNAGLISWYLWPARVSLAVGAALMTVQCALDLFCHVYGLKCSNDDNFRETPPESK